MRSIRLSGTPHLQSKRCYRFGQFSHSKQYSEASIIVFTTSIQLLRLQSMDVYFVLNGITFVWNDKKLRLILKEIMA